jgi:transcriptional regulator with XRE-family HTH domain
MPARKGSNETFGARLRRLRHERKLTIEQLGERAQIHWTYVSGLENELRGDPGLSVIQRVAAALDISVGELVDDLATVPMRRGKRKAVTT